MALHRKVFYRRRLPHWQPAQTDFFISYRLKDSLAKQDVFILVKKYEKLKSILTNLSKEKQDELNHQYFLEFDAALNANQQEPQWLKEKDVGRLVLDSLLFNHNKTYHLWCACIMPNHVHTLLSTLPGAPTLDVILQNHKKFTALHGNRLLNRYGQFWQHESYDRIVRSDTIFMETAEFILSDPVRAGFVQHWKDWNLLYVDATLQNQFSI